MTKAILVLDIRNYDLNDITAYVSIREGNKQLEVKHNLPLKELPSCKDCKFNYNNIEKDSLCVSCEEYDNMTDIVCTYWESDGLTPNDYCSQWKEKGEDK